MRHQSMADLWINKTMITAVFSLNSSTRVEFLIPLPSLPPPPLPLLYHFDWHSDLEFCMNLWCVLFLLIFICVDCTYDADRDNKTQNTSKPNKNCLVSYAICGCVSACGVFLHCSIQNTIYKLACGKIQKSTKLNCEGSK